MSISPSESLESQGEQEGSIRFVNGASFAVLLEQELEQQFGCFEQLYRLTRRQQDLLRSGKVDKVMSATRDKDRLMSAIRAHTEHLVALHASEPRMRDYFSAEALGRILGHVRRLSQIAHEILDLEKENCSIARAERDRAQSRLDGALREANPSEAARQSGGKARDSKPG